ncbi:MAG: hypothetical protein U0359_01180 [Byssovorax sp.]
MPLRRAFLVLALAGWSAGCADLIGADFDVHPADAGAGAGGGGGGGGSCADAHCVEVFAEHQAYPWDVLVRDGAVYWTVAGTTPSNGAVMKKSAAGGDPITLAGGLNAPNRVAVGAGYVWWTSYVAGGGVLRVAAGGGEPEVFITEPGGALGLLIEGDEVYYTAGGRVRRRAVAAGPGEGEVISGEHNAPSLLVSDGRYLYFGEFFDPGQVIRLDPATKEEMVLATGQANPDGMALASEKYLVFANAADDGSINLVDVNKGEPGVIKAHQSMPTTVAIGGDFVYWPSFGAGTVSRVLWGTSGTITTIAAGQASPNGLTLDETHVYWTNFDPDGAVMRALR